MYKVVSNYRLVLDDRLLETSKKILRLLFDKNIHVNEIIRQTSSDRSYIFSTIKMLEREGLITRNKRAKRGKKMVTQLTEVGHELADILRSLEQYKKSYFELRKAYEEKLSINEDLYESDMAKNPIVRRILRNKGFTNEEINVYHLTHGTVSYALDNCRKEIIDTVICRYVFTLSKFALRDTAKNILYDVIKDAAVFQLSLLMEEIEQQDEVSNKDPFKHREIEHIVRGIAFDLQSPVPGIIHNEIKNVTISRLNLLGLPKELGRKIISEKDIGRHENKPYKRAFDFLEEYINNLPS